MGDRERPHLSLLSHLRRGSSAQPRGDFINRTMESSRMLLGLLLVGLLSLLSHGQTSQEVSAEDFGGDRPEPAADRDLIDALEALLGRMHNRISSTEKRGSIPLCGMGDRCAMKFGPRIGKLCDCGRGANCNSYLLKCI
ncbi:cocaine- and amphetamine-regulated transcript-like isoform X1 [Sebastes fasciatus]|uniref:cocaine- and amphetamine-regulated transcript-like isoform X1 n=1 Tax=Sebastes fasciatus TaxID=394691 RepID=UPI003D9E45BA